MASTMLNRDRVALRTILSMLIWGLIDRDNAAAGIFSLMERRAADPDIQPGEPRIMLVEN